MRSITFQKIVTFKWELTEKEGIIPAPHLEALDERGTEIFADKLNSDVLCRSGELSDNIRMGASDPEDGIEYTGTWTLEPLQAPKTVYALPYSINVDAEQGGGSITSDLARQFLPETPNEIEEAEAEGAAHALESFLLALGCEGVNLDDQKVQRALKTAVDAIGNNL